MSTGNSDTLRLDAFKLELGELGVEQQNRIKVYSKCDDRWVSVGWQQSIGPFPEGVSVLSLRYDTVNSLSMEGFEMIKSVLTPISVVRSKKGKEVALQ